MKITQQIIDDLTEALAHTKKDGTENWKDGDEIQVCLSGTFAADKFITLINRTKNPVVSSVLQLNKITEPFPDDSAQAKELKDTP